MTEWNDTEFWSRRTIGLYNLEVQENGWWEITVRTFEGEHKVMEGRQPNMEMAKRIVTAMAKVLIEDMMNDLGE